VIVSSTAIAPLLHNLKVGVEPEFLAAWRLAQTASPSFDLGRHTAWTDAVRELHPGVFALRFLR